MEKILIVGGTTLLCYHTAKLMSNDGFEISVLARNPEKFKNDNPGINFIKADVLNIVSLENVIQHGEIIF